MLLRQKLDEILKDDCISTPPTPCWELLSELFLKTATIHRNALFNTITIMVKRESKRPLYEIILDKRLVVEKAHLEFTFDEVQKCVELAHYNFIEIDSLSLDKIAFVYKML